MAVTYILRDTTSDGPGAVGADFELDLTSGAAGISNPLAVSVAHGATETSYAWTTAGVPGAAGTSTGTFTVEVNVTVADANITLTVSIARVDSAGAVQSGPVQLSNPDTSLGATGVKTFSATNPALGTWAAGDRLRVDYAFTSSKTMGGAAAATIDRNTTDAEVSTPFTSPSPSPTDQLPLTDSRALAVGLARTDTLPLGDADRTVSVGRDRSAADTLALADVTTTARGHGRQLADAAALADSASTSLTAPPAFTYSASVRVG